MSGFLNIPYRSSKPKENTLARWLPSIRPLAPAVLLAALGCGGPRGLEADKQNASTSGEQETSDSESPSNEQPEAGDSAFNIAVETFCDKLVACKLNGGQSREECVEEFVEDSLAEANSDECVDAFADYWRCQSEQRCDDMGLASCKAEERQLDEVCLVGEKPGINTVKELPALKVRLACESMCERIDTCEKDAQRSLDECYEDCSPYPIGDEVADPEQCVLTTTAWAQCRAALPCEDVLENKGCEQEKGMIQCGA